MTVPFAVITDGQTATSASSRGLARGSRSSALRLDHLAEFLSRVRLEILLRGHHLAGDGRRARGERCQRDERDNRRRSSFHPLHSVRALGRASSSAIEVDNYDHRQLLQLRQRIIFVTPKICRVRDVRSGLVAIGVIRNCHVAGGGEVCAVYDKQ